MFDSGARDARESALMLTLSSELNLNVNLQMGDATVLQAMNFVGTA
jgi:hypothetical protein